MPMHKRLSLLEIIELITSLEPENPKVQNLSSDEPKIAETLDALALEQGQTYLSMGIGFNVLPLIVALHGLHVTAVDIARDVLQYQKDISDRCGDHLRQVGGSLTVFNYDYDAPYLTKPVDGFETPSNGQLSGGFDIVECVYPNLKGQERGLAHTIFNFSRNSSRYLVSSRGGPQGKDDKIVLGLMYRIGMGAATTGISPEIVRTGLYASNRHNYPAVAVMTHSNHLS